MKRLALLILCTHVIAGCTTTPPKAVVRTETVEVPRYIKQPVAPELTAPIVVDEPQATCNDGTGTVFCEDEIKLDRLLLKAAVDQCNRDRKTIRDGQGDRPC